MPFFARLSLLAAGLALSACTTLDAPTRAALPGAAGAVEAHAGRVVLRPAYDVQAVEVTVPRDLRVSEANLYYPIADIVWRGDAPGDRYAQVDALVTEGLWQGAAALNAGPAADVEVRMRRFHALTEKARYTVGGVHSIRFDLTLRDARTGEVLDGPREVRADLRASGGARALEEEARGLTQKVAIREHLARVIRRELSVPVAGPPAG